MKEEVFNIPGLDAVTVVDSFDTGNDSFDTGNIDGDTI